MALCTCKIVITKVEELRSAQYQICSHSSMKYIYIYIYITWKHKKRQKIKTHLPNRNYPILSQTTDIAKLKPIHQFKTSLLDKSLNLLPKHALCFAALFLNKPPE
jgi:hypothetical protein